MANTLVIKAKPPVRVVKVKGGIPGRRGDPGITVSAEQPSSPAQNALWIEVPPDA